MSGAASRPALASTDAPKITSTQAESSATSESREVKSPSSSTLATATTPITSSAAFSSNAITSASAAGSTVSSNPPEGRSSSDLPTPPVQNSMMSSAPGSSASSSLISVTMTAPSQQSGPSASSTVSQPSDNTTIQAGSSQSAPPNNSTATTVAIVAGVVGGVLFLFLCVALVRVYFIRIRQRKDSMIQFSTLFPRPRSPNSHHQNAASAPLMAKAGRRISPVIEPASSSANVPVPSPSPAPSSSATNNDESNLLRPASSSGFIVSPINPIVHNPVQMTQYEPVGAYNGCYQNYNYYDHGEMQLQECEAEPLGG